VDDEYVERPKRWDITFIKRFMVSLGPVSSLFDFLTFFIMLAFFAASQALFQTAWFIESLCSQILVVFVIRTRRRPFWKSKPSKYLLISGIIIIAFALILPFTPLGSVFGFVEPPPFFFAALTLLLIAYLVVVELVKGWFYKRYAYRLEQVLLPKRALYVAKAEKLEQDIIAIISLRQEDEVSIDSLTDDLDSVITYPINSKHVLRSLQNIKRGGLITLNRKTRMVKREEVLGEYVKKTIIGGPMWSKISEDWHKINTLLLNKYGSVNSEYQELLSEL